MQKVHNSTFFRNTVFFVVVANVSLKISITSLDKNYTGLFIRCSKKWPFNEKITLIILQYQDIYSNVQQQN